jgi:hypothetical protein
LAVENEISGLETLLRVDDKEWDAETKRLYVDSASLRTSIEGKKAQRDRREARVLALEQEKLALRNEKTALRNKEAALQQQLVNLRKEKTILEPLVTGSITGARKIGFRRGFFCTDCLGFFEKMDSERQEPFSYGIDESLIINVHFKNESEALHLQAAVIENVGIASPRGDLSVDVSVDPASNVVLDGIIFVGDYKPDKDSPPETPRSVSRVTELYDTSPLFKYQRLENELNFYGIYKADRAHLIDKPLCEKGKQFAKFQDNENDRLLSV